VIMSGENLSELGLKSLLLPPKSRFTVFGEQLVSYFMSDPLGKDYHAFEGRKYEVEKGVHSIEDEYSLAHDIETFMAHHAALDDDPFEHKALQFFNEKVYGHRKAAVKDVDKRVEYALELINSGLNQNISSDMIAEQVHVSASRLSYLFRRETGMTLRSYRQIKRVYQVLRARANGKSFTASSFEFGFHDPAHFTRTFKKYFDISPAYISNTYTLDSDR